MKLEQQVCSLELAKRLKKLGVKQDGVFGYASKRSEKYRLYFDPFTERVNLNSVVSAFTVAELGEMLPEEMKNGTSWEELRIKRDGDEWNVIYGALWNEEASTEADARAKMLVHLLENKLIVLKEAA
jgi:hypothetical protein